MNMVFKMCNIGIWNVWIWMKKSPGSDQDILLEKFLEKKNGKMTRNFTSRNGGKLTVPHLGSVKLILTEAVPIWGCQNSGWGIWDIQVQSGRGVSI